MKNTHPAAVPPESVAENPENPRKEFDEAFLVRLAHNMREVGQIQTATVMTRLAYLVMHPEHKDAVTADYEYVVIDGACRRRAARKAGIDLRITVDDSAAGTQEDLLAAALSANHFRADMTPIEEAQAIEALVEFHGSASAVVAVLGGAVNDSWISTRRALLRLSEPIQQRVAAKEVPIEIARKAGSLPSAEQEAFVNSTMAARAARKAQNPKPVRGRAAAAQKQREKPQPPATAPVGAALEPEGVPSQATIAAQQSVPEPRTGTPADEQASTVDWTDPDSVAAAILQHCQPETVQRIIQRLLGTH